MKNTIVKAVLLCTMALSLVLTGIAVVDTAEAGVAVCHDGHTNGGIEY